LLLKNDCARRAATEERTGTKRDRKRRGWRPAPV
jgi:hypothetical protein